MKCEGVEEPEPWAERFFRARKRNPWQAYKPGDWLFDSPSGCSYQVIEQYPNKRPKCGGHAYIGLNLVDHRFAPHDDVRYECP